MINRERRVFLVVAAVNLLIVLAFPPCDYLSAFPPRAPTFDGFYPLIAIPPGRRLNLDFFALEVAVVIVNSAIGWLLLSSRSQGANVRPSRAQYAVLWLVALNLVVMLLFPPFENAVALSRASLPSFDGFYFVFLDNSSRHLVTAILWIEATLVLVNGLLFWMLLRPERTKTLSAAQVKSLASELRAAQRR